MWINEKAAKRKFIFVENLFTSCLYLFILFAKPVQAGYSSNYRLFADK